MRRAQGEGSVYKRRDGRWVASRTIGATSGGNPRRLAAYGRTQREAREKLAAKIKSLGGELALGLVPKSDAVTVGEWITQWVRRQEARTDLKGPTKERYEQLVRSYLLPSPAATKRLQHVTPEDLRAVVEGVADSRAWSVAAGVQMVLRLALDDAVERQLLAVNPADKVKVKRRVDKRQPDSFEPEEVRALVAAADDDATRALLVIALTTGLRRGELAALRWQEVDLETGTLKVTRNCTARGAIVPPKTQRSIRTVSLPPDAIEALKRHRASQWSELNVLEQFGRPVNRNRVFTTVSGLACKGATLERMYKRARDAARVRPLWLHCLRHTHATLSLRAGVPVHVVSARLGHSNAAITLAVYSHVLREMETAAALSIAKLSAVSTLSNRV